jgi:hypothetical protein
MKIILILFANWMFLCACYSQQTDTSRLHITTASRKHRVTKDIQLYKGKPVYGYNQIHRASEIYKLDDLNEGYDSLEIRIWFDYSAPITHLFVIKRTSGKWSCQLYTIKDSANYSFYGAVMLPHTVQDITPRNGWPFIYSKLSLFNITSLPGSRPCADGVLYYVEVADKTKYRFYEYWSPEFVKKKSHDVEDMENILILLEEECGFKRLSK